jgi:hypothetical protein
MEVKGQAGAEGLGKGRDGGWGRLVKCMCTGAGVGRSPEGRGSVLKVRCQQVAGGI